MPPRELRSLGPAGGPSDAARELARALGLRPLTGQLLLNRSIADVERGRRFLAPRLADLRSPDGGSGGSPLAMAGFDRAVGRLVQALDAGETVGVFGDYDVDGVTTCALLTRYLRDCGGRVVPRAARRDGGYGFTIGDADLFRDAGCAVVITGDCGTSDVEAIAHFQRGGGQVIVVDHHQVPERDPGAFALINPHQRGCGFPFKGLASVGVAFYLACALRTALRGRQREAPDPRLLLDLVAVGTVADLAPLTDENRILVTAGLRELERGRRPGLRALGAVAGVEFGRPLGSQVVSFKLAPRLNAPGRIADANLALQLILAEDEQTAREHAAACEELNQRRRELQDQVLAAAILQVEAAPVEGAIVVAGDGWAPGVVGIVAAKLVERYAVPAVVIALAGDEGKGSARTVLGVHLYQALAACSEHLLRFGGHAAAAGLGLRRERLDAFRRAFQDEVQRAVAPRPSRDVDAEVSLDDIDEHQAEELGRLAPFGVGNPEPLLTAAGLLVDRSRVVGERHLQITLRQAARAHEAIAFGLAEQDPGVGARVRALFVPEMEHYRGARRLRLRVRELAEEVD